MSYKLNRLLPTTDEELRKIMIMCPSKTCSMDSCPNDLLKKTLHIHIPYLVAIVNNSFEQGLFLNMPRTAVVKPLPKSYTVDKDLPKTTDQTRPDQTRPDQTRPDQTRPDQTRPDPPSLSLFLSLSFSPLSLSLSKESCSSLASRPSHNEWTA